MTIAVTPEDDAPVAVNDDFMVGEDSVLSADLSRNLLANDIDVDMDALTIITTPVSGPSNGSVTINPDGTFTYTPNADFDGTDSFTYEINDGNSTSQADVTINVTPENDAPVAVNDDFMVGEDSILNADLSRNLLANDIDVDMDALTIITTPVSGPSNGSVTINPDGTFIYTPNANFNGTDSFTYEISDGNSTSRADVTINVTPENDAPVAVNDDFMVGEDSVLSADLSRNLLANDLSLIHI